jgi:hypothetical protein
MFDKYLSVDMLDYSKLFEESTLDVPNDNNSALSSIKEESKEEQIGSKKEANNKPADSRK